ncbi:MAG: hypothetical protein QOI79_3027 [Mycobacterium sp.]|jgi:alkylation response protein AidB-like acyl-CoA dehydrogenase|nr:hypothetical protein [Mycobacterium sp.]
MPASRQVQSATRKATAHHDRTLCNDTDKTRQATLVSNPDFPNGESRRSPRGALMDLQFDDETLTFQHEVRDFLSSQQDSFPFLSYDTAEGFEQHRRWDKVLYDAGLSVITWPRKYGGRDATLLQWVVYEEEYFRAGAPGRASANGTSMLAPTLFAHGTEEQLDRVLPNMASGEEIWAQAWSEPESGSDLASLRSTATRTDGGWLLNGQKIWSSRAPFGDRAFGLFRSDPEAQRHHGLTYFMFDLKADGITVRPIAQLGGDTGFGEIFLDDVFVPDADVIGEVHDGWRAAMSTSSNERGMSLRSPARFLAAAERLAELWKAKDNNLLGDQVADAWIKAQAYRLHTFGTVTRLADGGELGAESSVTKVFWSDLDVAVHQTALEIRGADGELANAWTDGLLFALGGPIYAGTNEIQRNIIAERLLGLPREKSK